MALAQRTLGKGRGVVLTLGVIGAAMFYGDSNHHAGHLRALRR